VLLRGKLIIRACEGALTHANLPNTGAISHSSGQNHDHSFFFAGDGKNKYVFGMAQRGVVREPYGSNGSVGPLFTPKLFDVKRNHK
jgi:hypothetical protein